MKERMNNLFGTLKGLGEEGEGPQTSDDDNNVEINVSNVHLHLECFNILLVAHRYENFVSINNFDLIVTDLRRQAELRDSIRVGDEGQPCSTPHHALNIRIQLVRQVAQDGEDGEARQE